MTATVERRSAQAPDQFGDSMHAVLRRVLVNRGVGNHDALDYQLTKLAPPAALDGITDAARLIANAVKQQKRTLIVGDFDADGATASAVCLIALRQMGHANCDFVVPNRFEFGYGLSQGLVEHILTTDQADLLVTVDNGISSLAGVELARANGVDVVITDHHLAPDQLPAANAIVNPNLPGCSFVSPNLAGVGVAFYVMAAVRKELSELPAAKRPNLGALLDLVALGTVADVVPLDFNNRLLVSQGLRRIRAGKTRPGIKALFELAGKDRGRASASDLGYFVAPRLNAAGRLEDMATGIRCMTENDPAQARKLASELHSLNRDRREIQDEMEADALKQADPNQSILCMFAEDWHEGVVGLIASKLKERYHRPAFAFAHAAADGALKGSARSIRGFHIRDALAAIDTRHPGLMERFGGHAMAAGLTLATDRLPAFRAALDEEARRSLSPDLLRQRILTDGPLVPNDLTADLALALRASGPWGQGFEEPVFDNQFEILGRRPVGRGHTKLRVRLDNHSAPIDALVFNRFPDQIPEVRHLHLVYQLDANEYMGHVSPQLIVREVL